MNNIFRTPEAQAKYDAYQAAGGLTKSCVLCDGETVEDFKRWKVMENKFPYDRIASVHYMLLPKRHITEPGLSEEEREELASIKQGYLHKEYDFVIEAMQRRKSIPAHFHLHLIKVKE